MSVVLQCSPVIFLSINYMPYFVMENLLLLFCMLIMCLISIVVIEWKISRSIAESHKQSNNCHWLDNVRCRCIFELHSFQDAVLIIALSFGGIFNGFSGVQKWWLSRVQLLAVVSNSKLVAIVLLTLHCVSVDSYSNSIDRARDILYGHFSIVLVPVVCVYAMD